MSRFSLEAGSATHVGQVRQRNEDSLAVFVPAGGESSSLVGLLLVADGMGGERAGDRASSLAAETLHEIIVSGRFREWPEASGENGLEAALGRAVREVSKQIYAIGEEHPEIRGLGTTVVLAAVTDGHVTVAHVGDSRCYRIRGNVIELLTNDHSWVARQVAAGVLSAEEARTHPHRNVLIRSLGDALPPDVDLRTERLRDGDLFVLCSDGLTSGVSDAEILAQAQLHPEPEQLCRALITLGNDLDGSDNITVVAGRCRLQD